MINLDFEQIKKSGLFISKKTDRQFNQFIRSLVNELNESKEKLIKANKKDIKIANKQGLSNSFIDRLKLDKHGIERIITRLNSLIKLSANLGEILDKNIQEDGLIITKVRVSLGVIFVIYEARPEVTIDVASLCIKSGNSVILKGGSEALNTNKALYKFIQKALNQTNFPKSLVTFIDTDNKGDVYDLLDKNKIIDLVIARGGYAMVQAILDNSKIPVLAHSAGGARIYIDKSADVSIINKILINAKTSKPSACNSLDVVVIHKQIVHKVLPHLKEAFSKNNVKILDNKWDVEFLGLKVAVKIVKDEYEAIEFINKYTKQHSEGIIAKDKKVIKRFINSIDAAAIFINSSTRFHDGFEFGLGAEMGIATGKLHARGPVGLKELTSYKWIIYGRGQIRE